MISHPVMDDTLREGANKAGFAEDAALIMHDNP